MPETEELRLIVTLDDQEASKKLAELRTQLGMIGGVDLSKQLGGREGFEGVKRQHIELTEIVKKLTAAEGELGEAQTVLARGFGAVGIGVSAFIGVAAIATKITKDFADEMIRLNATARAHGMSGGILLEATRQMREMGVAAPQAEQMVTRLSDAVADLTREGSELRQRWMAGAARDPAAMQAMITRLTGFQNKNDFAGMWNEFYDAAINIEQNAIRQGFNRQAAANIKNEFLRTIQISPEEFAKVGRMQPISPEHAREMEKVFALSQQFTREWGRAANEVDRLWESIKTDLLPVVTDLVSGLASAARSVRQMYEYFRLGKALLTGDYATIIEKFTQGEHADPAAEAAQQRAAAAARQGMVGRFAPYLPFGLSGLGYLWGGVPDVQHGAPHGAPAPGGAAPTAPRAQHFFGAGDNELSDNIIDLRGETGGQTDALEANTAQLKRLTDLLEQAEGGFGPLSTGPGGVPVRTRMGGLAPGLGYGGGTMGGGGGTGGTGVSGGGGTGGLGDGGGTGAGPALGGNYGGRFGPSGGGGYGGGGQPAPQGGLPPTAPQGQPGAAGDPTVPQHILDAARAAALTGGPGAVEKFMRDNGYPKQGNWCGEFAAAVVKSVGGTPPKNPQVASNWRNWGTPVQGAPQPGDVAVRIGGKRGPVPTGQTGSHVTFVQNYDPNTGMFTSIGGNQGNPEAQYRADKFQFFRATQADGTGAAPQMPPVAGDGAAPAGGGIGPRVNVSGRDPASIRYNNPGAQYPAADARRFGMTGYGIIGGGHKIAAFPTPVHGAASNFDLLARRYVGMSIGAAGRKWTGAHGFGVPGYDPRMVITREMIKDPNFAIPFLRAIAGREAGRASPLTPEQWQQAHDMYLAGGAGRQQQMAGGGGEGVGLFGAGGAGGGIGAGDGGEFPAMYDPERGVRRARPPGAGGLDDIEPPGMYSPERGPISRRGPGGGLDRSALSRSDAQRIEGTGKITVDVNAPSGTAVKAMAGGLFKQTEINRSTQMEPARSGPPAPSTAGLVSTD